MCYVRQDMSIHAVSIRVHHYSHVNNNTIQTSLFYEYECLNSKASQISDFLENVIIPNVNKWPPFFFFFF